MKILIVEDDNYKLDTVKRTLSEFNLTEYVHVNNYSQLMDICFHQDQINAFDLIILDLCFYHYPPVMRNPNQFLNGELGYLFLFYMAEYECKKDVIIYSSEENFEEGFKRFLFPDFSEYIKGFDNSKHPMTFYHMESRYKSDMKHHKEIFDYTDFVLGHAHNQRELSKLIEFFIESHQHQ